MSQLSDFMSEMGTNVVRVCGACHVKGDPVTAQVGDTLVETTRAALRELHQMDKEAMVTYATALSKDCFNTFYGPSFTQFPDLKQEAEGYTRERCNPLIKLYL